MTHSFNAKHTLALRDGDATMYRLDALDKAGLTTLDTLPFSIRVLLENVLLHHGHGIRPDDEVARLAP